MTVVLIANLTAAIALIAGLIAISRGGFVTASEHPHNESGFQPEGESEAAAVPLSRAA